MAAQSSSAGTAQRKPSMLALLKQRNLRTLWLAQTVSWSGDHFSFLALMIVINQITSSAGAVALLMITFTLPRLLFGMLAGVLVDRWDRQRVMVLADATRGVLALSLIWFARAEHVWLIYPLAFLLSTVGVFFNPARGAMMKTILKDDELLPANILMQTTYTLTVVLGPALAGITIGALGPAAAFVIDGASFFVSSALVASMAVALLTRDNAQVVARSKFGQELRAGLSYVASSRTISGLLLVLTVISLATGAANALFVPFLMNVLGVGATQLGIADSAQGIGMIAGGVMAAALAARLRPNVLIAGGMILASIFIALVGMAPSYLIVLALLAALGLVVMPVEAAIPALTQKIVPLDMMGRVGGTMNTSQSVATLLAMGAAGALADVIGVRQIFVVSGAIGIIGGLLAIGAIRDKEPDAAAVEPTNATVELAAAPVETLARDDV